MIEIAESARTHYPEHIASEPIESQKLSFANRYQLNKELLKSVLDSGATLSCTAGYIKGRCGTGHTFLKAIYCGKEYCPNCGQMGSLVHQRRMSRWFPKVQEMKKMGYLVITIPEELRSVYRNKRLLSAFRSQVIKRLVNLGYKRGLSRWHFFGDCRNCSGDGCHSCKNTGASQIYKPHLNLFIEEGFMCDKHFQLFTHSLKCYLKLYWRKHFAMDLEANVNYSYCKTIEERVHVLKYVTRATFRIYQGPVQKFLKGYIASREWGRGLWVGNDKQDTDDLVMLEKNNCPCCKKEGTVSKIDWKVGRESKSIDELRRPKGKIYSKTFDQEIDFGEDDVSPPKRLGLLSKEDLGIDRCSLTHIEGGYYIYEEPYEELELPFNLNDYDNSMVTQITTDELRVLAEYFRTDAKMRYEPSQFLRTKKSTLAKQSRHIMQKFVDARIIDGEDLIRKDKKKSDGTGSLFSEN